MLQQWQENKTIPSISKKLMDTIIIRNNTARQSTASEERSKSKIMYAKVNQSAVPYNKYDKVKVNPSHINSLMQNPSSIMVSKARY